MTTTTEQYAERIRRFMASHPRRNRAEIVLAMISTAVETGGTFGDVKRILAADRQISSESLASLEG